MSKQILSDQRIFMDGYELTTQSNSVKIEASKEIKDTTSFGSTWKQSTAGLKDFSCGIGGHMEIDEAATAMFALQNGANFILSVTQGAATGGSVSYFMRAVESSLALMGQVGEVAPFQLGASGSSVMANGLIAVSPAAAITATGTGTVLNFTGVVSGSKLKIAYHIVSVSGTLPTLVMTTKSSAVVGMTTPTTLHTSASYNAVGAEYAEVTLASTNAYFRTDFTVTGTNPSFIVLVSVSVI